MGAAVRFVALGLVVGFWGWYFAANSSALLEHPWQISGWPLALAVFLWCCYFLLMAAGWVLAVHCGGGKLDLRLGAGIWLSSMPARYVPGNVWHIAGRLYLATRAGVPAETTVLSSVVEQVLTVASEVIVFLLLLPFWPGLPAPGSLAPLLGVPLALLGLHPRLLGPALRLASRLLKRPLAVSPPRYGQLLIVLIWYVATALVNGLALFVAAGALGMAQGGVLPMLAGSYLLARALGFLSLVTPSGIGVREAILAGLLAPYLSPPLATALSLLARLLSTVAEGLTVLAVNVYAAAPRRKGNLCREVDL